MLAAPRADRTHTARYTLSIGGGTPPDHVAELRASVESAGRTIEETIRVPIAPAYQKFVLPFAYAQALLPHPSGGQFFVADDSPLGGTPHRVYGAFRKPDGSFTAEKTLSDTANNARQPAAHVAPNGTCTSCTISPSIPRKMPRFPGTRSTPPRRGNGRPRP